MSKPLMNIEQILIEYIKNSKINSLPPNFSIKLNLTFSKWEMPCISVSGTLKNSSVSQACLMAKICDTGWQAFNMHILLINFYWFFHCHFTTNRLKISKFHFEKQVQIQIQILKIRSIIIFFLNFYKANKNNETHF